MSVSKNWASADSDQAEPTIRVAVLDDLPRVQELDAEVFKDLAYPRFALRQLLDLHAPGWAVAERESELVGYSLIAPDFNRETAWLLALGVREDCRGQRIGWDLLKHSLDSLKSVDVKQVTLTVAPDNETAITLYKKAGFVMLGLQQDYYGPGEDRLLMQLHLGRHD
ncbi:GNAT family N-acetyltransferase [Kibdelosporangium aridum]|uniref:GNAT family N-acetyltransferase n=1 Tax=Kibdelosporangium aridum TaxID=2030 RepID=A0A428Z9J7_KIBAR|nr:GNAT family N-acetyltransferase [Kibdelosporangium aridum]RSM84733.1 GNAT family N-acetyltransferase [Kibdelosporangium aridum]